MSTKATGDPLLVGHDEKTTPLTRLPLSSKGASLYDEAFLQDLLFEHPSCLPIAEVDASYEQLIPVCKELTTPAGPLDILYITPSGKIAIVEAKLWRNPEARRKVIGQILDYAKELSSWTYEDLQREVSRSTGRKGNALYEIAKDSAPGIEESAFCDAVARSLQRGSFLLLIVGDGIREGAGAIADFIDRSGNLEFTFGLVELSVYEHPSARCLVVPRVLTRTSIVKRTVINLEGGSAKIIDTSEGSADQDALEDLSDQQLFYQKFWGELVADMVLDDQSQPMGNIAKGQNFFLSMPPSGSQAWISAYFSQSSGSVGVYLRFAKGNFADLAYEDLLQQKDDIESEMASEHDVLWKTKDGKHSVICKLPVPDPLAPEYREDIRKFFADYLNRFVNAFRPRLERISRDLDQ